MPDARSLRLLDPVSIHSSRVGPSDPRSTTVGIQVPGIGPSDATRTRRIGSRLGSPPPRSNIGHSASQGHSDLLAPHKTSPWREPWAPRETALFRRASEGESVFLCGPTTPWQDIGSETRQ